jgi:HlyD family secretion protein
VVDLERDPSTPSGYKWSSSRGPDLRINGGTLTQADVQVRDLPLLSLIIPPLRQIWAPKS